jgi:predicted porin
VTPCAIVGVGYNYTKGPGNGVDAAYNQVSLGGDYFLSKRTDIYAIAGYQHASGNTIDMNSGALTQAVASMSDFGNDSNSNSQTVVMLGMRHHF